MEASELELISRLTPSHDELRHLMTRHRALETDLERLEAIRNPTDVERREINRIKRLKLRGKDRISQILSQHR